MNETYGKQAFATHFQPLIGSYDSGNVAVLESHLLTTKLAGIDGVIVDWFGKTGFAWSATLSRARSANLYFAAAR